MVPYRALPVALPLAAALALSAAPAAAVSFHSTAIDVTPDGNEIWVVNPDHGSVSVLRARTPDAFAILAEVPVGREPWCLDIHPTNGEVWVASHRDDRIDIIDGPSRAVVGSIDAGFGTFGVAFAPAGDVALVTASGSREVFVVDVATRTVSHAFDVYRAPRGIAWSADGAKAWVSHLLMPEYFGKLTVVDAASWTTSEINLLQVFGTDRAGYPSCMQNITLAPAGDYLWLPTHLINSAKGVLSGVPLTPTNIFHAVVRPVNALTGTDLNWDTYFLSEGGSPNSGYAGGTTPVGGPIAVDFKSGRAYVANLNSNNVTILDDDIMHPRELGVLPAGAAPIGIVAHPDLLRAYVANWLGRSITAINTNLQTVIGEYPTTTAAEPLPSQVLNGKKLFYTSTGRMSFDNRNSCTGCHVMGGNDARNWDLTQTGLRIRATKNTKGVTYTGPHGWTSGSDEIQDNEWSIRRLLGGVGLVDGTPNPGLGAPNAGLSADLDDLAFFVASQEIRPDTPYLLPDGSLTPAAEAGRALFLDPVVGCATCHSGPFYTDSSLLASPYLRHDVGTGDPVDSTTAGGLDTPSLVGCWDDAPYLHNHVAKTMVAMLTTFNPADEHGVTSHLTTEQIEQLAEFVNSIGWPDSAGSPVDAPVVASPHDAGAAVASPNPFRAETSLRFSLAAPARDVRVDVYDVTGRHVRSLLAQPLPRGTHIVGWDGRNTGGRAVAAGTYFARWSVDGARRPASRMTIVR